MFWAYFENVCKIIKLRYLDDKLHLYVQLVWEIIHFRIGGKLFKHVSLHVGQTFLELGLLVSLDLAPIFANSVTDFLPWILCLPAVFCANFKRETEDHLYRPSY